MNIWERVSNAVDQANPVALRGVVTDLTGLVIEGSGPAVGVGATCSIIQGEKRMAAQVVGFRRDRILLMPLGDLHGIAPGATILAHSQGEKLLVSDALLGRVFDPLMEPLDDKAPITEGQEVPLFRSPPSPLLRKRINEELDIGVKAVNSLLTLGKGQRLAIMSGSGVGKSTFLGMIARHGRSALNVIALVGERGREVREFIERDLGPEGLKRSVIVVATSDRSALMRIRAAFVATAIAEYFRDQGEDVTLMVDSITRFCMSQREIGLAAGEPPSTSGYTPSVFAILPKLLERAGTADRGSITGLYNVLVEGDDMNEPVTDAVRGIVDGHIVLSRALASKGQYPAIDILESISRLMPDLVGKDRLQMALQAKRIIADYREVEDLITIGAYKEGQNPRVDYAVQRIEAIRAFLMQTPEERFSTTECQEQLAAALGQAQSQPEAAGAV